MKLRNLRHPSTAAKHIRAEQAAQFTPLSEYDLDEIDRIFAATTARDRANLARINREELDPSED